MIRFLLRLLIVLCLVDAFFNASWAAASWAQGLPFSWTSVLAPVLLAFLLCFLLTAVKRARTAVLHPIH